MDDPTDPAAPAAGPKPLLSRRQLIAVLVVIVLLIVGKAVDSSREADFESRCRVLSVSNEDSPFGPKIEYDCGH